MKILYFILLLLGHICMCVYAFYLGKEVEAYKIIKQIENNNSKQKVFNFYKKIYTSLTNKRTVYQKIRNIAISIAIVFFIVSFLINNYGNY